MALLRVSLTGGIATGKSYVRARVAGHGIPTLDADTLARDAVAPASAGFADVVARFGAEVVAADGSLDRKALGAVVFADPQARADLEAIVHPRVREATGIWLDRLAIAGESLAIVDIPLLFETGRRSRLRPGDRDQLPAEPAGGAGGRARRPHAGAGRSADRRPAADRREGPRARTSSSTPAARSATPTARSTASSNELLELAAAAGR